MSTNHENEDIGALVAAVVKAHADEPSFRFRLLGEAALAYFREVSAQDPDAEHDECADIAAVLQAALIQLAPDPWFGDETTLAEMVTGVVECLADSHAANMRALAAAEAQRPAELDDPDRRA